MTTRQARPLHAGRLIVGALVVATAPMWWRWAHTDAPAPAGLQIGAATPSAVLPASALQLLDNQDLFARLAERETVRSVPVSIDPIGNAPDLKRVFDDYIARADAPARRIAIRAFQACVPAFLPAAEQSPSPDPLIAALPPGHRAERAAAYRSMFARCQAMLATGRVSVLATAATLAADGTNEDPGARAQEAALAGRLGRVDALLSEALNAADPAAVASVSGLAARIVRARDPEERNADAVRRAQAVDAALPLVACDLGLDCGKRSLVALQLCAAQGWCEGDVPARLTARVAADGVRAADVQEERARLLALIRSGRTLRSADLMPHG